MGSTQGSEGPTAALSCAPQGLRGPALFTLWISTSIKTPKNAGDSRARQVMPRARQPCGLPEVSKHGVNRGALILTPTTSLFVSQSEMPKARETQREDVLSGISELQTCDQIPVG